MVEQITFQTAFQFLQTVSIMIGIAYYLMILQNQQKTQKMQQETRQISTYIQTIGFRDADYMKAYGDITYFQKYDDYEDWKKKYHPTGEEWKDEYKDSWANFFAVGNSFQSAGLLIAQGIISPELVYEQEGELIMSMWERMGPIIIGTRKDSQQSTFFSYYEYLYEEMKKIWNQKNPEQAT